MGAAASSGSREDGSCSAPWEPSDGVDPETQAWLRSVSNAKSSPSGGVQLGGLDVPPDLDHSHREPLRRALVANKNIRSLTVGDVSSPCARLVAEAVAEASSSSRLKEVKFVGPRADDSLARLLGMLLRPVWSSGAPALESLTIAHPRRNLVTDSGAIPLLQALEDNSRLRVLVLFGTQLGDGAAWAAAMALEHNTTLESLVLYGKRVSVRGIAALTRFAKAGAGRLTELVVGGTEFRDQDATELLHAVASGRSARPEGARQLRKLGLLNALLGDESVRAATEVLSAGLDEVSLVLGRATDEGAAVLSRAVGALATGEASSSSYPLQILRFASASVGDAGIAAFESAWTKPGLRLELLELAFGAASSPACTGFAAASGASSSSAGPRKLLVTSEFGTYMDEVLFPRIMMRSRHEESI